MNVDLINHWKKYINWIQNRLPEYGNKLNPPADEAAIKTLVAHFDFDLPEEVLDIYRLNNGEELAAPMGAFLGFNFLSIPMLIEVYDDWIEYGASIDWEGKYHGSSFPNEAIKIVYAHPKWIPLFADAGGNYVGIDLDPDAKGTYGQVINFGRDEDDKFVIANSLLDLLTFVISELENGNLEKAICKEDDGTHSYGLIPQSHLIDDLKAIIV